MAPQVSERPPRLLLSSSTMIPYLLFPLLIFGVVESHTANVTEKELREVEGNQTLRESTTHDSLMKLSNVTSSLYKDEKSQIEDELQNNQTSAVTTEDDESFQDQEIEFPAKHCHHNLLVNYSHSICGEVFHTEMLSIGTENWCVLENIIRPYNDMTLCLEKLSHLVSCYYPNADIQDFFVHIHAFYFQDCSQEGLLLEDAPNELVIVLTLIPVSLVPVLVYLTVWKKKSMSESC